MSLPFGFKYFQNMAIYETIGQAKLFVKDYGKHLEGHYDRAEKKTYPTRIFCLDCPDYETCKGKWWKGCPTRADALRIIRRKL